MAKTKEPSFPEIAPEIEYVEDMGDVKLTMWQRIKGVRETCRVGGFQVGDKWFHSDDSSRTKYLTLATAGVSDGLQWKTLDGSFITMTAGLLSQIIKAMVVFDTAVFDAAQAHKVAMLKADTPEEYDFSGNWPKTFGTV